MPYGTPRQNDRYSRPQAAPVQARHEIGSFHGRGRGGLLPAIMAMSLRIFRDAAAVRYWTLVTYPNGRDFLIKQEAEADKTCASARHRVYGNHAACEDEKSSPSKPAYHPKVPQPFMHYLNISLSGRNDGSQRN